MKREPSIHVLESDLIYIFKRLGIKGPKKTKLLVRDVLKAATNKSLNSRAVIVSTDKIKRDVKKITTASLGDTKLLNNLIFFIRKKTNGFGVMKIKEGNGEWTKLKDLSKVCVDFCNDFELGKKQGFTIYLEIALPKISSSRNLLTKLINMYESICIIYNSQKIIDNDNEPRLTNTIHDYYVRKIESQTGLYHSFKDEPNVYKCFVGVKEIVNKYNVPFQMYIDAQFIGLSFTESIATPYQLITEKAIDRLNNYLFKNKLKLDLPDNKKTISLKGLDILKKIKG